jgi:hypothetical protein
MLLLFYYYKETNNKRVGSGEWGVGSGKNPATKNEQTHFIFHFISINLGNKNIFL